MGFLDNSGDILLDAVLTDTGRFRLAKGDGSFKIAKFALGDDEINYRLFNKSHASGSAYFDLDILGTPIFEAFTNNTATMQSKLLTISRTNLLYLPILKLNELPNENARHASNTFVVCCNETTEDDLLSVADKRGVLKGARPGGSAQAASAISSLGGRGNLVGRGGSWGGGTIIRVDQGLDTTEISPAFTIDADLVETQYIIEMDNRFGSIVDINGTAARASFIDDDNISSYYLSLGTDPTFISENRERDTATGAETIRGPRGTMLRLKIRASIDLQTSSFLFGQLGNSTTVNTFTVDYIDTTIRISGATTGYRLDLPIRFVKRP